MKGLYRVLIIFLVVCMVFSTTACKKGNRPYDPNNFIEDTSNPQIVKEKVTIKLFVPQSTLHGEWEDMKLFQKMEEWTNIHIEFQEVPLAAYNEKRSLAWNDSTIDGFFLSNSLTEIIMSKSSLRELSDTIGKYAPDYCAYMEQYPEMRRVSTLSDGGIYSFATINQNGGDAAKQYINKRWLEDLGLDMPQTTEEYYNVLKAFKEQDPNGNGRNDEIPLSMITADQTRNFILSAFGYVTNGIEVNASGDGIVYVPTTDNYREYLKYMNKLYAEGLIDKSMYSNKDSDLAYMGQNEMLGSFSSSGAFLVVGNDLDNDYTAVGPLTSSVNSKKMWYQFSYESEPTALIINKSSPYYRELVRWMNVFYTKEFEILQSYGEEGTDWSWDDTEKTSWTFNVPSGMEREQFRATLTYQAGLGGAIVLTDFGRKESSEQNQKIYAEADTYKPYLKVPVPIMQFTLEEMQTIASLETDLSTYMITTESNFITGKKDPSSDLDWAEHLDALERMNVAKLVSIYANAFGRYCES